MTRSSSTQNKKGFTLIELLVVVSIIGFLSTVIVASLASVRTRAMDARRAADLQEIQAAIVNYRIDNGHYPNTNGAWTSFDSPAYKNNAIVSPNATNLSTALAPYIKGATDPNKTLSGDQGYLFYSPGDTNTYCILIYKTPQNLNNYPSALINHARCSGVDEAGQCIGTGPWNAANSNSIYLGAGSYTDGC